MKLTALTCSQPGLKFVATLLLAGALMPVASAQETVRYEASPSGNTCSMDGTSSLHDWTMTSSIVSGFVEADANFPESALTNTAFASPRVAANMPVRAFKSGKAAMDEKMQNHMQVTKYSRLEYRLISLKPKSKPGATGPLEFDAVGTLTIVGNTVTNTMPVTIEKQDGKLKVVGSTSLKMSEYKLEPPRISLPLLPDITVGDELKIKFDWNLVPKRRGP